MNRLQYLLKVSHINTMYYLSINLLPSEGRRGFHFGLPFELKTAQLLAHHPANPRHLQEVQLSRLLYPESDWKKCNFPDIQVRIRSSVNCIRDVPFVRTDIPPKQGPVSRKTRKLFGPLKPQQNLQRYDYRAVLFSNRGVFLRTALRDPTVSGAFKKRAAGPFRWQLEINPPDLAYPVLCTVPYEVSSWAEQFGRASICYQARIPQSSHQNQLGSGATIGQKYSVL